MNGLNSFTNVTIGNPFGASGCTQSHGGGPTGVAIMPASPVHPRTHLHPDIVRMCPQQFLQPKYIGYAPVGTHSHTPLTQIAAKSGGQFSSNGSHSPGLVGQQVHEPLTQHGCVPGGHTMSIGPHSGSGGGGGKSQHDQVPATQHGSWFGGHIGSSPGGHGGGGSVLSTATQSACTICHRSPFHGTQVTFTPFSSAVSW